MPLADGLLPEVRSLTTDATAVDTIGSDGAASIATKAYHCHYPRPRGKEEGSSVASGVADPTASITTEEEATGTL